MWTSRGGTSCRHQEVALHMDIKRWHFMWTSRGGTSCGHQEVALHVDIKRSLPIWDIQSTITHANLLAQAYDALKER